MAQALPLGTYSVSATLTDAAGNSRSSGTVDDLVVAAQPVPRPQEPAPVITAPEPAAPTPPATPPAAPAADTTVPAELPVPGLRSVAQDISSPMPSAPALNLSPPAETRLSASGDVTAILTIRGQDAFQVLVLPATEPALVLYRGVGDQNFDQVKEALIRFQVPSDAFMHTDVNATVKLVATLSTGEPLPSWLQFDPTTGRFEGTVPTGIGGELVISIKAIDMDGRRAETIFRIKLVGNKLVGRQGLADQLRLASKRTAGLIPLPQRAA